jgi:hypothetical protein
VYYINEIKVKNSTPFHDKTLNKLETEASFPNSMQYICAQDAHPSAQHRADALVRAIGKGEQVTHTRMTGDTILYTENPKEPTKTWLKLIHKSSKAAGCKTNICKLSFVSIH